MNLRAVLARGRARHDPRQRDNASLAAPAGTAAPVAARLERAIGEMMRDPAFAEAITGRGFNPEHMDGAGTVRALEEERALWAPVLERARITPE